MYKCNTFKTIKCFFVHLSLWCNSHKIKNYNSEKKYIFFGWGLHKDPQSAPLLCSWTCWMWAFPPIIEPDKKLNFSVGQSNCLFRNTFTNGVLLHNAPLGGRRLSAVLQGKGCKSVTSKWEKWCYKFTGKCGKFLIYKHAIQLLLLRAAAGNVAVAVKVMCVAY